MKDKLIAALHSPDFLQRVWHFALGTLLFHLPTPVRAKLFQGTTFRCPICNSGLRSFPAIYREHMRWCPVCFSLQRHRLVWLFLHSPYVQIRSQPRRMLHLAPEPGIATRLAALSNLSYINADMFDPSAMLRLDLCNLGTCDNAFDLVYCSHVLEHVQSDLRALSEMRRVLRPGSHAIILVPITAAATFEDPTLTDPAERERLFGQHDHVRRYGPDFADRLRASGFEVTPLQSSAFATAEEARMFGINPNETIFWCHKPD